MPSLCKVGALFNNTGCSLITSSKQSQTSGASSSTSCFEAFIVTVILAANLSFLTPFGYQTNLLVMAPGQYKFLDYIKCGIPLTLLSWIIFILFIPRYFNLS